MIMKMTMTMGRKKDEGLDVLFLEYSMDEYKMLFLL